MKQHEISLKEAITAALIVVAVFCFTTDFELTSMSDRDKSLPVFTMPEDYIEYYEEQYVEEAIYSSADTAWIREYEESLDKGK